MPFVILKANSTFKLSGWMIGGFITAQMIGSIFGNIFILKRLTNYKNMLSLSYLIFIISFTIAYFTESLYGYISIFLLFGIAIDGFKIATMNLVIEISPEDKRPIYTALQTNLSSIGLFFPLIGAYVLENFGYDVLYILTISILIYALLVIFKLKRL